MLSMTMPLPNRLQRIQPVRVTYVLVKSYESGDIVTEHSPIDFPPDHVPAWYQAIVWTFPSYPNWRIKVYYDSDMIDEVTAKDAVWKTIKTLAKL